MVGEKKKKKKNGGLSPAQIGSTSFALFQRVHFISMPWSNQLTLKSTWRELLQIELITWQFFCVFGTIRLSLA